MTQQPPMGTPDGEPSEREGGSADPDGPTTGDARRDRRAPRGGPRRPIMRASFDGLTGAGDPAEQSALAHETAAAVVRLGRDEHDAEMTARLVGLADEMGLEAMAELWRHSSPDSLPGTLWALYLLRTWVRRNGVEAARVYAAGCEQAEVASAVAGVAEPPGPAEMATLGDAVLTSVFDGDLAIALDRAAAFSSVVGAGRLGLADDADDRGDDAEAARQTRLAAGNARLSHDLTRSARLWRADALR